MRGALFAAALGLALASAFGPALAFADGCALPPGGRVIAASDSATQVSYRFEPEELKTDRHFSMIVDACSAAPVDALSIDAQMPEHRHGMNYKPVLTKVGAGRWKADGLLLHMPGRWEFRFDVRAGGRTERLSDARTVE